MGNESATRDTHQCPYLEGCPLFNNLQDNVPNLAKRLKQTYCLGKNSHCARLYITQLLGTEHVPVRMMPQQWEWANLILIEAGKNSAIRKPREMELNLQQ